LRNNRALTVKASAKETYVMCVFNMVIEI